MSTTTYQITPGNPVSLPGSRAYVFELLSGGPMTLTRFNDGEADTSVMTASEPVEFTPTDKGTYILTAVAHGAVRVSEDREAEKTGRREEPKPTKAKKDK